jgi:hypothetical protein
VTVYVYVWATAVVVAIITFLYDVVKCPYLGVNVQAMVRWANKRCVENGLETTGAHMRDVLGTEMVHNTSIHKNMHANIHANLLGDDTHMNTRTGKPDSVSHYAPHSTGGSCKDWSFTLQGELQLQPQSPPLV